MKTQLIALLLTTATVGGVYIANEVMERQMNNTQFSAAMTAVENGVMVQPRVSALPSASWTSKPTNQTDNLIAPQAYVPVTDMPTYQFENKAAAITPQAPVFQPTAASAGGKGVQELSKQQPLNTAITMNNFIAMSALSSGTKRSATVASAVGTSSVPAKRRTTGNAGISTIAEGEEDVDLLPPPDEKTEIENEIAVPLGDGYWALLLLAAGYAFFCTWRRKNIAKKDVTL